MGRKMRLGKVLTFASAIPLAFSLLGTAARACQWSYTPTASGFCDQCQYEATISLSRNETCERSSVTQWGSNLITEYIDSRISVRAKHGVAGANGNVVAYQPSKDYVGNDEFTKESVYRQNGKLGRYSVRYSVTVK